MHFDAVPRHNVTEPNVHVSRARGSTAQTGAENAGASAFARALSIAGSCEVGGTASQTAIATAIAADTANTKRRGRRQAGGTGRVLASPGPFEGAGATEGPRRSPTRLEPRLSAF